MAVLHGDVDGPAIPRTLYVHQPIDPRDYSHSMIELSH